MHPRNHRQKGGGRLECHQQRGGQDPTPTGGENNHYYIFFVASVFSTFGVSVLMNSILVIRSLFGTRVREIENIRIQLHHFVFTNDDDSLVGKPPDPGPFSTMMLPVAI